MAVPVWVTDANLGIVYEKSNLLKQLNTSVSTDVFTIVSTQTWLSVSSLGVMQGVVPDTFITKNESITVRATATDTSTTDKTFLLIIQPTDNTKQLSWVVGSVGTVLSNTVSELTLDIENFEAIEGSASVYSRSEKVFDFNGLPTNAALPQDWTFRRSSIGHYIRDGRYVTVDIDIMRPFYKVENGAYVRHGVLVETETVNRFHHSGDFTKGVAQGGWEEWSSSAATLITDIETPGPATYRPSGTEFVHELGVPMGARPLLFPVNNGTGDPGTLTGGSYPDWTLWGASAPTSYDDDGWFLSYKFGTIVRDFSVSELGITDQQLGKQAVTADVTWTSIGLSGFTTNVSVRIIAMNADENGQPLQSILIGSGSNGVNSSTAETFVVSATLPLGTKFIRIVNYQVDLGSAGTYVSQADLTITAQELVPTYDICYKLEDVGTGSVFLYQDIETEKDSDGNYIAGATASMSILAKSAGEGHNIAIALPGNVFQFEFDIDNGVMIDTPGGGVYDAGMDALINGWYRCWIVGSGATGNLSLLHRSEIHIYQNTNSGTGVYFMNAQVEYGDNAATYIESDGQFGVRGADLYTIKMFNLEYSWVIVDSEGSQAYNQIAITDKIYTLTPRTGQWHVTQVTISDYHQSKMFDTHEMYIYNDTTIGGTVPVAGTYYFDVFVEFGGDIVIGPETFSFTSTDNDNGRWDVVAPLLFDDNIATDWHNSNVVLLGADTYRPFDRNFGASNAMNVQMAFGIDHTRLDLSIGAINEKTNFGVSIGALNFVSTDNYDLVYYEIVDKNSDEEEYTFKGHTVKSKSFELLRSEVVKSGFAAAGETLPAHLDIWDSILVVGYVDKGKGQDILTRFAENDNLRTLVGRTMIVDRVQVIDRFTKETVSSLLPVNTLRIPSASLAIVDNDVEVHDHVMMDLATLGMIAYDTTGPTVIDAVPTLTMTTLDVTILAVEDFVFIPENTSFIIDWATDNADELQSSVALSQTAQDYLYTGASNTNQANNILAAVAYYADKLRTSGNGDKTITMYFTRVLDIARAVPAPIPAAWGNGISDSGEAVLKIGPIVASDIDITGFGTAVPAAHFEDSASFTSASVYWPLVEVANDRVADSIERVIIMRNEYNNQDDTDYLYTISGGVNPTVANKVTMREGYYNQAKSLRDQGVEINWWQNSVFELAYDGSYLSSWENPTNPTSFQGNSEINPWDVVSATERSPKRVLGLSDFGSEDDNYDNVDHGGGRQTTAPSLMQQIYGEMGTDIFQRVNVWDHPWVRSATSAYFEPYQDNGNQVESAVDAMFEFDSDHRGADYTGAHRYWRINITETLAAGTAEVSALSFRDQAWATSNASYNPEGSGTWIASSGVASAPNAEDHADLTTTWLAIGALPQWIGYDFGLGNDIHIENIVVGSKDGGLVDDPSGAPVKWDIEWSDDGVEWNTISGIDRLPDFATHNLVDHANNTGYVPPVWYEGDTRIFPVYYMQQFRIREQSHATNPDVITYLHGMYIPQGYSLVIDPDSINYLESYFTSNSPSTDQIYKIWKESDSATATLVDHFAGQSTNTVTFNTIGGITVNTDDIQIDGPEYIEIWTDPAGAGENTFHELILPLQVTGSLPPDTRTLIKMDTASLALTANEVDILPITVDTASMTITAPPTALAVDSGATAITSSATSINVDYPADIIENDLLVMSVMCRSAFTIPPGWALEKEQFVFDNSIDQRVIVISKRATGAETGSLTITQATANRFIGDMMKVRYALGVKSVTSGQFQTTSTAITIGGATLTDDALIIGVMTSTLDSTSTTLSVEAGYTLQTPASGNGTSRLGVATQIAANGFSDAGITFTIPQAALDFGWVVMVIE